jgi:hypothetical protein
MTERLTQKPVPLTTGDTPAWQLWAQLAQFARHLQPTDWVLVGGQMVALHCHIAGITPGRATTDIQSAPPQGGACESELVFQRSG